MLSSRTQTADEKGNTIPPGGSVLWTYLLGVPVSAGWGWLYVERFRRKGIIIKRAHFYLISFLNWFLIFGKLPRN